MWDSLETYPVVPANLNTFHRRCADSDDWYSVVPVYARSAALTLAASTDKLGPEWCTVITPGHSIIAQRIGSISVAAEDSCYHATQMPAVKSIADSQLMPSLSVRRAEERLIFEPYIWTCSTVDSAYKWAQHSELGSYCGAVCMNWFIWPFAQVPASRARTEPVQIDQFIFKLTGPWQMWRRVIIPHFSQDMPQPDSRAAHASTQIDVLSSASVAATDGHGTRSLQF